MTHETFLNCLRAVSCANRYGKPVALDMMDLNMYKSVEVCFEEVQKGLLQSIMDKSFIAQEL